MYFKRIDLHGFKSFADPVSVEFHEGVTCIVGPNGSGKSNISDAIRWVLGEQSPKMLRGGKMEEVIFAGTANRKSRGMAEVTLVIDNSKGILDIDYAEVAITRRMYRSGESEYSINNNPCRLRDIRELIMDTGIGVDGYSLIGQGKIADIVSNKPESRREIFEEAAGIVKYRSKKAEAERKLDGSKGNLDRVNDIILEIESRIDGLKDDSKKASEYLILRDRYKELEINVTLKNIENIQLKNEYIKDDLIELTNQINEIKEDKTVKETEIEEYRKRNEELDVLLNNCRDRLMKCIEEINNLVNNSQLSQEKLTSINKDEIRLKEEILSLGDKLKKEENTTQELLANKNNVMDKLDKLQQDLSEMIHQSALASKVLSDETEKIESSKNSIYRLHSTVSSKNSEINSLKSLQIPLARRKEQLLSENNALEALQVELSLQHTNAELDKKNIEEKIIELKAALSQIKNHYNENLLEEKTRAGDLEEIRISIGKISTRKRMLEEMESSYDGYNNAVKFILKGKFQGINGVVADLIEVPKGFETAIETALGGSIQNIVCEDDASAQFAIQQLKANKAGRLTFLPIKNMKAWNPNYPSNIASSPGFKGFGVECISFDPKYKGVMEYLLSRVIIVDSLKNAVALSKKTSGNFRFVTFEGEVINSGGAITGGTFKSNSSNLLERKAEVKKLAEDLIKAEDNKEKIQGHIEDLRKKLSEDLSKIQDYEKNYHNAEIELLSKQNHLQNLGGQLSDWQANRNKWQKELESIDQEQISSQTMIEEIQRAVEEFKKEIESTERLTDESLVSYDSKKTALDEINEEITKARITVSREENEKDNVDQYLKRIEEQIKELREEKELKEKLLDALYQERTMLQQGYGNLDGDIEEKEAEKSSLERYLAELQEEKGEAGKYLNEITRKKESIDEIIAGYQNEKYELEIKQAKNETQLDTYKDKLWDEFEVSYIQAIEFKKKDFILSNAVKETREVKSKIKDLGEVNVGAIKEYETVSERYEFLTEQRNDILSAMNALKQIIDDMDKTIRQSFKETFDKIVMNFEGAFKELFGGGTAELRIEDESKPLESGIEIVAQPPGKKLQNINLMSGGEKTMTAIALMFAVLKAKPTPFCILDEVEAALDDSNIDRFAKYLTNFNEIQFALVTHQKATMEYADVLYGVTMPEQGVSKIISLKLGDDFEM